MSLEIHGSQEKSPAKFVDLVLQGTPAERKAALRQLQQLAGSPTTDHGFEILDLVLPVIKASQSLERHRAVKVLRRVVNKLGPKCEPYAHKTMTAVQPMLIDPQFLTRKQGREILAVVSRAVGLPKMFVFIKPDLEHPNDLVRKTTAETLAALAAQDPPKVLPFICAACQSHNHIIKATALSSIVAICRIVPGIVLGNLPALTKVIGPALKDNNVQCRMRACSALSAAASACSPYGIETLEICLPSLWAGVRTHNGIALAQFLRALASLMPLMDPDSAEEYTHAVLNVCRTHLDDDDEVKKSILRAIEFSEYASLPFLGQMIDGFFTYLWNRRLALDRQALPLLQRAAIALSRAKIGQVLEAVVATNALKEQSPFQLLTLETLKRLLTPTAIANTSERTQERICDGLVTALAYAKSYDQKLVGTFGAFFVAMGPQLQPYLEPLVLQLVNSLNNPLVAQRELAARVIAVLAPSIQTSNQPQLLATLGNILYEQLGEESPKIVTAVLEGLTAICSVVGLASMQPPIGDLLPRLTPILRNRDDDITQSCIILIGRIAQRGHEFASAREWMRIANELIEIFKAPRKTVRRLANDTFGYIAKGLGPSDVLASLLTTLKLERQSRVNSAVAIAIIADVCEPYAVVPVLLNEYRAPDINVQHGTLKALSFLFESVGTKTPPYIYSVVGLVDHALTNRNQVHRQTAASIVKHLALNSVGSGNEDVLIHFLNELWPHIFESSPHVIDRIMEAVEAVQLNIGVGAFLPYLWAGLFHPSRATRKVYWNIYNHAYVQSSHCMVPHYPVEVPAFDVWF